jgi:hypothetical protein
MSLSCSFLAESTPNHVFYFILALSKAQQMHDPRVMWSQLLRRKRSGLNGVEAI